MEQIIADFRAANQPLIIQEEVKQEAVEEKKDITRLKLDTLAKDLSKIISRMERKVQKEKELQLKEALEKRKKEQEQ